MLRELARESFLVAARDQLGLRTRDVSLGDEMPGGGDNAPFEVLTVSNDQSILDVRRGFESPGKTLRHEMLGWAPAPAEEISKGKSFTPIDYRAFLAEMEKLSRGGFADAIRQAGFHGKPNSLKDSADVPQEIEKALKKMDFMSQFSAVRQLHELIRTDGESPERLGALVRGYANLGLLTEFHWHPAHKAFKARSLVYAQRMASADKQPWRAAWHRAYAFALAGLHQLALEDLETAEKQWKAKEDRERPGWVDLIDAYCRFAHARLKAADEEGPEQNLAQLLWFDSIQHSYYKPATIEAAVQVLQKVPDCYPVLDGLCQLGGTFSGQETTVALVISGKTIYPRALAIAGLPPSAVKIVEAAGEDSDADGGMPVKEFGLRGKLIRALVESDRSVPAKTAGAAPPAEAAALDRGEPSWVCLGHLISNLSFAQAWRHARYLHSHVEEPAADFVKVAAPLVEVHPYRQYLATFIRNSVALGAAWEKVSIPAPDDLGYQEAAMWLPYRSWHLPTAAGIEQVVDCQKDGTCREFYLRGDSKDEDCAWWSAALLRGSPFSPVGLILGIEFCGDKYKSRFGEWEKAAADHPAVAMAFAHRAIAADRWEEAEKWLKLVAVAGGVEAFEQLAKAYASHGQWHLWVATLEYSLTRPHPNLWRATANTSLARYYMHCKQWEKAVPYAQEATDAVSDWGMRVLAECREQMHDWTAAEDIYRAMAERYSGSAPEWYDFCRRTGHGDIASARRAFAAVVGPRRVLCNGNAAAYYLLEKEPVKAKSVLRHQSRDGNPVYDLHLALFADQAHDNATRDTILARVKQNAAQYRWTGSRRSYASLGALAGLIADDLAKGGKGEIDLAAAERLSPPEPFEDDDVRPIPESKPAVAFAYLLGRYLDQHGKPELAQRCWKRCLAETDFVSDFNRTLAAAELLSRGIQVESEKSRPHEAEGQPKSPP
jgi:hypothetical protein